jgi:plasmid stabilization system protein ParE
MGRELIVTSKARRNLKNIATYISINFGDRKSDEYLDAVNFQVQIILKNPQRYRQETINSITISICVFKKKTIIQFVYNDQSVTIVSILDERSNWN